MFEIKCWGKPVKADFKGGSYHDGSLAIWLQDQDTGETLAKLSVCIPSMSNRLPDSVFFVKHWAENEDVVKELITLGKLELVKEIPPVSSGHVSGIKAYRVKK